MTQLVLEVLANNGYQGNTSSQSWADQPLYFMSTEYNNLKVINDVSDIPLVFVVGGPANVTVDTNKTMEQMTSDSYLDEMVQFVTAVAPHKDSILPLNQYGYVESSTGLVDRVQRRGMQIFVHTFQNEDQFLSWTWQQDPYLEYYWFIEKEGIDGAYSQFPQTLNRYLTYARYFYLSKGFPIKIKENGGHKNLINRKINIQFEKPYIIAHRGACGVLPEHTLPAYELAIQQGAHFIECDVVLTQDLVPICRHEPNIINTTDAALKFPQKITTKIVDGVEEEGIFTVDLTLDEIKTLTANQSLEFRDPNYNGQFKVPSLEEYIKVAQGAERTVGIYPETKHPTWHDNLDILKHAGTTISDIVLDVLTKYGYKGDMQSLSWRENPVFIQSFEVGNLKYLSNITEIPLVLLLYYPAVDGGGVTYDNNKTFEQMTRDEALDELSGFISGLGPHKNALLPVNQDNQVVYSTSDLYSLVRRAQKRGLLVHPFTYRNEDQYLANNWRQDYRQEYDAFLRNVGIDGAFTDFAGSLAAYLHENVQGEAADID
eukprot:TRINITY_DN4682_c1_g1_i1.p1 TRINITY_DN4682_c1_g1~~TRINITY_DN4682_c1_g1_i1.p1  ORF type:complete len:543 (-),score=61.04 TRINITY_DN4682_c1_g1_i1:495-2123(-)